MDRTMTSRIALVTGASQGIGAACALALSEAGHRVALVARNVSSLEDVAASLPGESLVIPTDVLDPAALEAAFAQVESTWGPVEILVVNAGAAMSATVVKTTDEDWQRLIDLNLTAPFRCIRRAVPGMVERGFGRIVVVASVAAKAGEPYICAYTASKHGVLGLVRSAAAEVASSGVTVNAVCPGYVETPMTESTVAGIVEKTGRTPEEARTALEHKQPIGRLVSADEVAQAVAFCVANGAVNGQGVNIDGGAVQS